MAANYKQPGKVVPYPNGGSPIASGDVVIMGVLAGVALADIGTGETGSVQIEGVFEVPKAEDMGWSLGDQLNWNPIAKVFTDGVAEVGNITGPAFVAFQAAADSDLTALVKFTGAPGVLTP